MQNKKPQGNEEHDFEHHFRLNNAWMDEFFNPFYKMLNSRVETLIVNQDREGLAGLMSMLTYKVAQLESVGIALRLDSIDISPREVIEIEMGSIRQALEARFLKNGPPKEEEEVSGART